MLFEGTQTKFTKDFGYDTHSRSVDRNIFQSQSKNSTRIMAGEILITQPEPLFRQTAVTVKMAQGGILTGVAYPNAFVDPISGNLHGLYEGPIPGQMVTVGHLNGNSSSPIIVNRYPYHGSGDTTTDLMYIQPLTRKMYDSTDTILGHFSGSVISLNTGILSGKLPGSITVSAMTTLDLMSNTGINITTLGGLITIENAAQNMKVLMQDLITAVKGIVTVGSETTQTVSPGSQAALTAEAVKWNLLLG